MSARGERREPSTSIRSPSRRMRCGPRHRGAATGSIWTSGRAILSGPEAATIGPLKRRDDEPLFDEPWQAQVLAMADTLSRSGAFTATEWSEALGDELRRAEASAAPDNATTYYEAALRALERLLIRRGIATS